MPRTGTGLYVLPAGNPVIPGTVITASWCNPTMSDIAQALTYSLTANGETAATGNLPMAGFRHTTVGKALAAEQYTRADQTQTSELLIVTTPAWAPTDVYSGDLPLATVTFTQYQIIFFPCPAGNVGPATLNINGSGPKDILHADGSPIVLGDLVAGVLYGLVWNTNHWQFLNTALDYTSLDARYIQKTGDTMLGALQVIAPVGVNDATSKAYVDAGLATKLPLAGGTLTGPLVLAADPAAAMEAATRQYVLAVAAGGVAGVSSFNTRVGAITLLDTDVIGALGYTPANPAGQTFTGAISAPVISSAQTVTATGFVQTVGLFAMSGSRALVFSDGQSQVYTLTGAINFTSITGLGTGNILRLTLENTNLSVAWPSSVKWPLGIAPDLAAGPLKKAIVVLEWSGAEFLATASVY